MYWSRHTEVSIVMDETGLPISPGINSGDYYDYVIVQDEDGFRHPDIGLVLGHDLLVNVTSPLVEASNFDLYVVCSVLANLSAAAFTTSSASAVVTSLPPTVNYEALCRGLRLTSIWRCLLGFYDYSPASVVTMETEEHLSTMSAAVARGHTTESMYDCTSCFFILLNSK